MTTTEIAAPLPLDQVDVSAEYYGVKVVSIGEEGEIVAAFTHDERRALAAVRRYVREHCKATMNDCSDWSGPVWWQVFDHCGCTEHEVDEDGIHDCSVHGCECRHFGVQPCYEESNTWIGEKCDETALNAIPVIEFEPSY